MDIGLDRWAKYLRIFGFGSPTNFDLADDAVGIVPDTKYYNKVYGEKKWGRGMLISLGIGQGELSVTTLQQAQYMLFWQIMAKQKSHILAKVIWKDYTKSLLHLILKIKLLIFLKKTLILFGKECLKLLMEMELPDTYDCPILHIAGKTGTSQNPHGEDHALFVAFAPYENPQNCRCCYC